eukprot:TRINITY_DN15302_c0_g1_i2.p1 TRINITY_DN15302_c0_g1~~TRINITY_DN15302_c0_g1_i2.p1  ORF type:complete len:460 (+),score=80.05 TRINITY_DN15302_c0_g1_i2:85-1380(+)
MGSLCPGGSCTPAEFDAAPPVPTEVPVVPAVAAVLCITGVSAGLAAAAEPRPSPRTPPGRCPEGAAEDAPSASSDGPGESTGGVRRRERLCRTTVYGAAAEPRRVRLAEAPQPGGRAAGAEEQPPQRLCEEVGAGAPPPAQLTPAAETPAAEVTGCDIRKSPPAPAESSPRPHADPFAAAFREAMRAEARYEEREQEQYRRERAGRRRWEEQLAAAAALEAPPTPPPPPPQDPVPPAEFLRLPTPRRNQERPAEDWISLEGLFKRCAARMQEAGVRPPPAPKRAGARGGAARRRAAASARRLPAAARGRFAAGSATAAPGAAAKRPHGAPAAAAPLARRRAPAAGARSGGGRRAQPAAAPPPAPELTLTLPDAGSTVSGVDAVYSALRNAQGVLQAGKSERLRNLDQEYTEKGKRRKVWKEHRDGTPKAVW